MDLPYSHSSEYRLRRFINWFPLGLSYALLYMGRYNLAVCKNELGSLMSKESFGWIFGMGAVVYGFAFLINGPLTDKIGGKRAILISMFGAAAMNIAMGFYIRHIVLNPTARPSEESLTATMALLYAANMYFQSYGAVAIVKVNSHWFHVRERGGFSGIFGTMISSGIFLAFTVNGWLLNLTAGWGYKGGRAPWWVFFAPAALLLFMFVFELIVLKDKPSQAGFEDFDTGDASSGEAEDVPLSAIVKRVLTNPIILTVALIEFCTGVLRNGVMHWFPIYTKEIWVLPDTHFVRRGNWGNWTVTVLPFFIAAALFFFYAYWRSKRGKPFGLAVVSGGVLALIPFLQAGWGGILMVAGVAGGNIAGWISDLVFGSRRAPVAAILYGLLIVSSLFMLAAMGGDTNIVGRIQEKKLQRHRLDPKSYPLKVGDKIVAVAKDGTADGKPKSWQETKSWFEVAKAVACLPAKCIKSHWDQKRCICSRRPKKKGPELKTPPKYIPLKVERSGGKTQLLLLPDHGAELRAGEKRRLLAAPKLAVNPLWLCLIVFLMSLGVIGTHGLLSGTATMDFGGRRGAATAVGIIDGFVYLGTAVQSVALGYLTSKSWTYWPLFLLPFGILGFVLLLRIWNAIPSGRGKSAH